MKISFAINLTIKSALWHYTSTRWTVSVYFPRMDKWLCRLMRLSLIYRFIFLEVSSLLDTLTDDHVAASYLRGSQNKIYYFALRF